MLGTPGPWRQVLRNELKKEINEAGQVKDFYNWSRDYWIDLSRSAADETSGMLNFGYWEADTANLYDAQINFRAEVAKLLGPLEPHWLGLEIGCGIGGLAAWLASQAGGARIVCLDLVQEQLVQARARAEVAGVAERILFGRGSSMSIPFAASSFDFAYCIESSFHYPDKAAFAAELFRVLRPGAAAVLADITCSNLNKVTFRSGNHFCSGDLLQGHMQGAGLEVQRRRSIGGQVFGPLCAHAHGFNQGRHDRLAKYWNLVLTNYAQLWERGLMDYELFRLYKPIKPI
jgi:2-polyprenyl-3-methyl-5-hydroxy-6-metoxy-1,4-benzoquinol methylase